MGIFSGLFKSRNKPRNSYDSPYSSDVNIKPDKEKSTEKIDGAVAMIMALDRAIRCGCVSDASVYDTREMLVL